MCLARTVGDSRIPRRRNIHPRVMVVDLGLFPLWGRVAHDGSLRAVGIARGCRRVLLVRVATEMGFRTNVHAFETHAIKTLKHS
jgi:hypothetical protein